MFRKSAMHHANPSLSKTKILNESTVRSNQSAHSLIPNSEKLNKKPNKKSNQPTNQQSNKRTNKLIKQINPPDRPLQPPPQTSARLNARLNGHPSVQPVCWLFGRLGGELWC